MPHMPQENTKSSKTLEHKTTKQKEKPVNTLKSFTINTFLPPDFSKEVLQSSPSKTKNKAIGQIDHGKSQKSQISQPKNTKPNGQSTKNVNGDVKKSNPQSTQSAKPKNTKSPAKHHVANGIRTH